mmetsp:Transcript_22698/g.34595  ORF Transcript_22698/g.34595 Transcript_22698/m.34595 type:complete len:246 (+) Transcript_22698:39-776(+)
MWSVLFLLSSAVISSSTAFVTHSTRSIAAASEVPLPPRSLTVVSSAKILPIAYTGVSAALLTKAIRKPCTKAEMAVLLATSGLSLINLGPSDNANLASAKRACKNTAPSSSGKAKQERQTALTWRKVVRIKIIGQVLGLSWMVGAKSTKGVMDGGACIMGSLVAFFLAGAARSRHDEDGKWTPMPSNISTMAMTIDAILFAAALVAGKSTVGSTKFSIAAGIYSFGAAVGALEGIPKFLQVLRLA